MASPWTADSSQVTADSALYTADGGLLLPPPTPPTPPPSNLAAPQPLLSTTLPAYVYKQYADDDDIQAFFAAYNAATQTYVDWFTSVNLPFYPALTGDLLDWVAEGLYGLPRMSLAQSTSGALGPLNTEELNTAALNSFTPPSVTYYTLTDDVFKRILTWNFYKGDGKRFNMMWLKRRIMRFLLGANGLDVNPYDPSFVIGTENTQAIGVQVSGGVLTVSINQPYISRLVQLAPGIINIFNAAFTGGVLELPLQYTYEANIVTHLTATVNPNSETVTGIATTLSTGSADVSVYGGSGAYTFAWTWQSGGAGITINSPSAQATTFTASGMSRGATLTGVALCSVTDTSTSQTAMTTVSVAIQNVSAPVASIVPSSYGNTIATWSYTTGTFNANVTGGGPPYTYAWTWTAGGSGITIASPTSSGTDLYVPTIAPGTTLSGTLQCTVTDAYGQTSNATSSVGIARATQPSASASPPTLSLLSTTTPATTGSTTVTASGGISPYTYSWGWQSGGADLYADNPAMATTSFTGTGISPGNTYSGVAQCIVTDALGQQIIATVEVSITYQHITPVLRTFTNQGATSSAIPTGAVQVVIEGWGPGGPGGAGDSVIMSGTPHPYGGGGGGAGGYFRTTLALTSANWGETIAISATSGTSASTTVSSGTFSLTTLTAHPGSNGFDAVGSDGGTGGAGGTSSNGNNANTTGSAGGNGGEVHAGIGAAGTLGVNGGPYGSGGQGGNGSGSSGLAGAVGAVLLYFT